MSRRVPIMRSTLVPHARYDAAGTGRRLAKWSPPSTGPRKATEGLQRIRDRARDSGRNDWGGARHAQQWTTTLVGTGIVPRWENRRFAPLWADWVKQADADYVLDLYGMQALAVRTWVEGGECFIRARWRRLDAPLAAPLQIQLLESDMCPLLSATAWPGMPAGNEIRQGVEFNSYGRRVAYWFYKDHPGDGALARTPTQSDLVRVSASDVRHLFEVKRPGQVRGVSDLAAVLVRLRQSVDFEDAVLDRQKLANLFTMFITKQLPDKWLSETKLDPLTGLPAVWNSEGDMLVGLESGAAMELKPGENVQFANPPEAGTTFSEYMRTLHLGTAAGGGLPYELFSGDIQNVSDRTLRVVINEFRRYAQQRQWHNIIPQMAQPVVEWWAEAMGLSGAFSPAEVEQARRPRHSPHGWEYIHPVQDVEGKVKAIEAGLVSRDSIIAERGDDPIDVDEERRAARDREERLDLLPPAPAAAAPASAVAQPATVAHFDVAAELVRALTPILSAQPVPAVRQAAPTVNLEGEVDAERFTNMVVRTHEQNQQLAAAFIKVAEQLAARTLPDVHVNVPSQPVPIVNVDVQVPRQAAPVVHVPQQAAPVVQVDVQVPQQSAPTVVNEVVVAPEVKIDMPTRRTLTEITRDAATGDIVKVVQTEKTVEK